MISMPSIEQVPVQERERILKKEGLDPTRLQNLTLIYKVQEVRHSRGLLALSTSFVMQYVLQPTCHQNTGVTNDLPILPLVILR